MTSESFQQNVIINEAFYADSVARTSSDVLLADGWRHFGSYFFRYNFGLYNDEVRRVLPLRVRLSKFRFSKSQRRTINKNRDLRTVIRPIEITDESNALFDKHRFKFWSGVPDSIYVFVSGDPAYVPNDASEIAVYDGERLVAISYLDEGNNSTSGVYAYYDTDLSQRRLGIFTMLKEIEYSIETGREFYYPGFAYEGPSFYDYKKMFNGLEAFDWNGNWWPYSLKLG